MAQCSTFSMLSRSSLILGLKSATIVVAALAVFYQDLAIVMNDALQTESMSHILAIPFLFAYLIYRKRKMLRAVIPTEIKTQRKKIRHLPIIAGILLSVTAILAYWHGSYTFTPLEYHILALPVFVAGLTLILFNMQTLRQLAFPIAFLIFLTPPPSEILYTLGSTLSIVSSQVSYVIIVVRLGIPAVFTNEYDNPIIQITQYSGETMKFAIDIACSGIYSMIGFLIFSVFVTYIIRDRPWKKLALFLVGFSLIYVLNITRITTILFIGYHYGEETALQLFHMLGGWILIFIGTLLLLLISEKIFHTQLFTESKQECSVCKPSCGASRKFCFSCGRILVPSTIKFRKTEIAKIALIIISAVLLMSIQAPVFALTEGPAQIIIQTPLGEQGNTQLLPQVQNYTLEFVYRDKRFEEIAGQDASLLYAYVPFDKTKQPIWVTVEIGSSTSKIHRWEVCLINIRTRLGLSTVARQLDLKDLQIQENPPIIARYFAFQWIETNKTEAILYWYETSRFISNRTTYQEKRVKISVITYPDTPTAEDQLIPFATAIVNHWQPIKTWSQIALLLSQNGSYLAMTTGMLLATFIIPYAHETRKLRKANAMAYQKLSKPSTRIVDTVLETEKAMAPTLSAIETTYRNRIGDHIEEGYLLTTLSELEKLGILKSQIANNQDEPTQIWKTQISEKDL